jgi:hypothetical protein
MKTVHVSIPCVVWINATVEVQDDANKDDIFNVIKNRLRDLSELRRHVVSVAPYKMIRLVDLNDGELCVDNDIFDPEGHICEWSFETE